MLSRTFIVFHDCGHGSYTTNRLANELIGIVLGVFVVTPFSWNYSHHNHHKTSGNIDNALDHHYNESVYHTVSQYLRLPRLLRMAYRVVRHPVVYHTLVVPILYFGFKQRVSIIVSKITGHNCTESVSRICFDLLVSNLGICVSYSVLLQYRILYQYLASLWLFTVVTSIVFHCEHTFNPSYVVNGKEWCQRESGLRGSSFIDVPWYLKYFTSGIEYHHIHHMNSKLPGRSLRDHHETAVANTNQLDHNTTLSLRDCIANTWLILYDEDVGRYVQFSDLPMR